MLETVYARCGCCSALIIVVPRPELWEHYKCPQCVADTCWNTNRHMFIVLTQEEFAREAGFYTFKEVVLDKVNT